MINEDVINYLHETYPELVIDKNYIRGYSAEELIKIGRLYDVKLTGQLYEFLLCMGRCSGGLFGDDPLVFYRDQWSIRGHVLFQAGFRDELCRLQRYDLVKHKPFFMSIESETQYYFVLTTSDNPNLVYHYDENEDTVTPTQFSVNEYLKHVVNVYTRLYIKNITPDYFGEILII